MDNKQGLKIGGKIALGTAQFGFDYGISNEEGRPSLNEIEKILSVASKNNISYLDTALAYGDSEKVIGKLADKDLFKVITKIAVENDQSKSDVIQKVNEQFKISLSRLKRDTVYGLLVHNSNVLLENNANLIWNCLHSFKKENKVSKIGVSVYNPTQLKEICRQFDIDIVQLPLNIFDQRFLKEGLIEELSQKKVEVHVRSVFLQGLIFIDPEDLNDYFSPVKDKIRQFHSYISENGRSPLMAALEFVVGLKKVSKAVVGVNNSQQLVEILDGIRGVKSKDGISYSQFHSNNKVLINPTLWEIN